MKRNQNSQLRRGRITKTVLTHVALCGLEETQQQTRFLIGPPEEYVRGHTLSIMLTQISRGYSQASIETFSGTLESLQKSLNLRVSRTWNGYLQAIGLFTLSRLFIVIRSGYYRVFDSQNLSLKLGFWIHAFAGIDAFWIPERMDSEKNHLWEF